MSIVFAFLVTKFGLPAVIGIISLAAFCFVYLVRKYFGKQWDIVDKYIPALNFSLTPGLTIVSKFAQMLPATLVAAAIGAVTSGGALTPTLIAAAAGPLAALGHELLKSLPFVPYTGSTPSSDPVFPSDPKLPTGTGS